MRRVDILTVNVSLVKFKLDGFREYLSSVMMDICSIAINKQKYIFHLTNRIRSFQFLVLYSVDEWKIIWSYDVENGSGYRELWDWMTRSSAKIVIYHREVSIVCFHAFRSGKGDVCEGILGIMP